MKYRSRRPTERANRWRWHDIEQILPAGADRDFARRKIEELRRGKTSAQQRQKRCEDLADSYDRTIRLLLKAEGDQAMAEIEQLTQRSAAEKAKAQIYAQVAKVKRPHFVQQCELLWLWQSLGGDLRITTPKEGDPYGPVIPFFQAASLAVFGKTPAPFQIRNIVQRNFRRLNEHHLAGAGGLIVDAKVIKTKA